MLIVARATSDHYRIANCSPPAGESGGKLATVDIVIREGPGGAILCGDPDESRQKILFA